MKKDFSALIWVSGLYVGAQILADITSLRILSIGGFSLDGGTLIYPITFTLRDLVHKNGGKSVARHVIFVAAVLNLFMAFLFWLVGVLPPDPTVGSQETFGALLSPVWRIVIASIVAEVISELIDGEVYSFWVHRHGQGLQWLRVLVSNAVSVPLDSILFSLGAFAFGLDWKVVQDIILANILVKMLVTLTSLPLIYTVPQQNESRT